MTATRHQLVRLAVPAAALVLAAPAAAAVGAAASLQVTAPKRVVQGNPIRIEASARTGMRCTLAFRYRGGAAQKGLGAATARAGRATWTWDVPRDARPGAAVATVRCAGGGQARRTVMVVGSVIPASITVVKQGFSVRPRRFTGADVSWGVIVKNTSPQSDAIEVTILANLVGPDNKLVGSATVRVPRIAAGREQAAGGDMSFIGVPNVARLEVVAQIRESGPRTTTFPSVSNVRVVPDPFEPGPVVGSVEGELVNDHPGKTLERAQLFTVVLDADGNVLGGQQGYAIASLPPATRQFFKINGMRGVWFANAASAYVTVVPTYR